MTHSHGLERACRLRATVSRELADEPQLVRFGERGDQIAELEDMPDVAETEGFWSAATSIYALIGETISTLNAGFVPLAIALIVGIIIIAGPAVVLQRRLPAAKH